MILNSYAKLNLYLAVLDKRADGFHNILTIFERIDLADTVILKPAQDNNIIISCRNRSIPLDNSNLCYKSAQLLQKKTKVKKGVHIEIIKRIPVGAGLGGGSSNAACVLVGLNKLWKLGLSVRQLADCAAATGSDVSFFIHDTPFAKGEGRGERIKLLPRLKKLRLWHILVVPRIQVSTPLIYRQWDRYSGGRKRRLTTTQPDVTIARITLKTRNLSAEGSLFNSLEPVTIKLYPEVGFIKEKLLSLGVQEVLMSGSGPAVFGLTASHKEAERIKRQLRATRQGWDTFAVRTR